MRARKIKNPGEQVRLARAKVCLPDLWGSGKGASVYGPTAEEKQSTWPLASKNMIHNKTAAAKFGVGEAQRDVVALWPNGTLLNPRTKKVES